MYYFYMGSVLLPIAPEKFTVKVKNSNKTMTLINDGEINLLKEPGLTDLEFDALIPVVQYPFAKYDDGFQSAGYFLQHFEKLKISKAPFQFIVSRKMPDGKLLFDTNMSVSLESYTIKEDVKQGFDFLVSFKLKQYKPFGTKNVKVTNGTATVSGQRESTTSPAPKNAEVTHTVTIDDTLWGIAKRYYGDGSKYPKIYEANKAMLDKQNSKYGNSKYTIYSNQVLVIPPL